MVDGGASAVKELGQFEARKSSSQLSSDMVTFFSFSFTLLPKQSYRRGGAGAVDLPAGSFDPACPGLAPPLTFAS